MDPFRSGYMPEPQTPAALPNQLRAASSMPERILWWRLRNRQFRGLKFRRQHPMGVYVADFYCDELRLVVEVDGSDHSHRRARDAGRDRWMTGEGLRVIRVSASAVSADAQAVLNYLGAKIDAIVAHDRGADDDSSMERGEKRSQ